MKIPMAAGATVSARPLLCGPGGPAHRKVFSYKAKNLFPPCLLAWALIIFEIMKRTAATRLLILVLILGTVLSLPGGLLAAVGASASGCPHCRGVAAGLSSACCCCVPGTSGHCGNSSQGGSVNCRCGSGSPAYLAAAATTTPAMGASPYVAARVTVSSKLFPPNIFHPPEL